MDICNSMYGTCELSCALGMDAIKMVFIEKTSHHGTHSNSGTSCYIDGPRPTWHVAG